MYAKLNENKSLQKAPNILKLVFVNPTEEQLKFAGYKEVIEGEMPEVREGYYLTSHYEDKGEFILKVYEEEKIEEPLEALPEE